MLLDRRPREEVKKKKKKYFDRRGEFAFFVDSFENIKGEVVVSFIDNG